MKKEFRAHPLMLVSLIKPFLFVLVLPVLKGVIQYIIKRRVTGVLTLELNRLYGNYPYRRSALPLFPPYLRQKRCDN